MQAIAHNITSQFTSRQLNITTKNKAKSAEKLSAGYRINRSGDDAAGLQISEKMRWQIKGLDKGSNNSQEGISLLQVADGALSEVHDMLQRMNELVIQAANDTNTEAEREAIQKEINSLMVEIDRVGSDTEFNTQKIFQGGYTTMVDASGNPIPISSIPVSDFELGRTELQNNPFLAGDAGWKLGLGVSTVDGYTPTTWDLVYHDGSTSHSALRVEYEMDDGTVITQDQNIDFMPVSNYNYDSGTNTYSRKLSFNAGNGVAFDIEQRINIGANSGTEQYYNVSYSVVNTGTRDAKIDFLFNADTAYNNVDSCEGYFINGTKVDNFCMYTSNTEYLSQGSQYVRDISEINATNSFSIIDEENALPFAETVKWSAGNGPDTVVISEYYDPDEDLVGWRGDWDYLDDLSTVVGDDTENRDIVFSMIWNRDVAAGDTETFDFQYGIIKADSDPNLSGVPITYNNSTQVHVNQLDLWIQSGATKGNGLFLSIGEMNCDELGLRGVSVEDYEKAGRANVAINKAINIISKQRSSMGAQQNRLEHIVAIDDNTSENTQAAESRIRDAEMAEEIVQLSKHSILEQAGQAMLAQANQSQQGILNLLQ